MSKKIVFMGTPEFSVQSLKLLVGSEHEVVCVYSQPPKKSFRGQKINLSPVHNEASKLKLNIRTPNDLNTEEEYKYFKSLNPYLVIVVAYGKIIPKKYLNLSQKGFLNIHASLLPKWRGAAPIQRSIMNSDIETGISIMKIEEKLDTGPYMIQAKIKIDEQTTTKILSGKLSKLGAEQILRCISLIEENKAKFINQDHEKATYAKKIEKSEAKINWNDTAKNILLKINSLNPSPGAWFLFKGSRYKIWKASISNLNGSFGEIINEDLTIACSKNSIKVLEIQKEGKKSLSISKFLIGNKFKKGEKVSE
tara:strand:+ start:351 stop:1274 length:924 start_codon:yes stop_codon:yes gene_type:complete